MFYNKLSSSNKLSVLRDFSTELTKLCIGLLENNLIELQPRHISGTYNSLSRLNIYVLQGTSSAIFKSLIVSLANRAVEKDSNGEVKIKFNAQGIANIFNALSKWVTSDNIDGIPASHYSVSKSSSVGKSFNAQDIANIFNALSKWVTSNNIGAHQALINHLAGQELRDSASIIKDLPKLKHLMTKSYPLKGLLKSLVNNFTHIAHQNRFSDLSRYISDENFWTAVGIKNLAESIKELEFSPGDKAELKQAFDADIPKVLSILSRFRLNSHRLVNILEGVTKLISLGFISDSADIRQPLNRLFENFKKFNNENKLKPETLTFFERISVQEAPKIHADELDLKLTPANIAQEYVTAPKRYNLPEELDTFKREVLKGIEYISTTEARNKKMFLLQKSVHLEGISGEYMLVLL